MTIAIRRTKPGIRAFLPSRSKQISGRVSRRDYEQRAESPGVQRLIANARQSWERRYGEDPAIARLASRE
jgi:hypothetical protein